MGFVSNGGQKVLIVYKMLFYFMSVLTIYSVFHIIFAITEWFKVKKMTIWYIFWTLLRLGIVIALVILAGAVKLVAAGEMFSAV